VTHADVLTFIIDTYSGVLTFIRDTSRCTTLHTGHARALIFVLNTFILDIRTCSNPHIWCAHPLPENYSLHVIYMPHVCVRNIWLTHILVLAFILEIPVLTFIRDTRRCSKLHNWHILRCFHLHTWHTLVFSPSYMIHAGVLTFILDTRCTNLHTAHARALIFVLNTRICSNLYTWHTHVFEPSLSDAHTRWLQFYC